MRVTVHIPDPIGRQAENAAREEGKSVSALFAESVQKYLDERRRNRAARRIEALIGTAEIAPNALEELKREREASNRDII